MAWNVNTATAGISGVSSMGTGTSLSRSLGSIPGSARLTSVTMRVTLKQGGLAATYAAFSTSNVATSASWLWGFSYVPTGTTVPTLGTDTDNPLFLLVEYPTTDDFRSTINQAGSPAYNDLFGWVSNRYARFQVDTTVGGSIYLHIANAVTSTVFTGWSVMSRATWSLIN